MAAGSTVLPRDRSEWATVATSILQDPNAINPPEPDTTTTKVQSSPLDSFTSRANPAATAR